MKIVIIGAQAAGMTFAMRMLKNNPNCHLTIIDENNFISFGACGLPYYVGDFFNDSNLMFARSKAEVENERLQIFDQHSVYEIDEINKLVKIKNLITHGVFNQSYDKLIIATGSSAKVLPQSINSSTRTYVLKTTDDANKIKLAIKDSKKVAIIGAGYIGLELLEAFIPYNLKLSIFDIKEHLSGNLIDKDFEDILAHQLKHHNINVNLSTDILDISDSPNNKITIKYLDNNKNTNVQEFDFAIISLGFKPNTSFLDPNKFNLLNNGAIITDTDGKTSVDSIYAIGDCATIYHKILQKNVHIPLATIANKQARAVADRLCNINNHFCGSVASSCLKFLDLEIAKTGITEFEAIKENISYESVFIKDYNHTNYYPNQLPIYVKLIFSPGRGEILGCQIVGENGAMLRIHAITTAIESKLTIYHLATLDFAYAPPFNRTWDVLNLAGELAIKQHKKKII